MYVATLTALKYSLNAIGNTQEECRQNLIRGFKQYMKSYRVTFGKWLEDIGVDYADYNNDMWTFLHDYYGVNMFDITKGYALGWE